jgi:TusA-related sulfurtransferase
LRNVSEMGLFRWNKLIGIRIALVNSCERLTPRGNPLKAHADAILDLRGSIIPMAMLEFTRAFKEMKVGGIMDVLVGDRETKLNLFKVLRAYPYELLDLNENNSVYRVRLKKEQDKRTGVTRVRH